MRAATPDHRAASFGRRPAGCVPAAPIPLGRCHAPCLSAAALPLRSGQRQSQLMDSFGLSGVAGYPTRPALPAAQPLCRCSLKEGSGLREWPSPPLPTLLRRGGEGDRFFGRRTQGRNVAPKPPAFRPWATFLNPWRGFWMGRAACAQTALSLLQVPWPLPVQFWRACGCPPQFRPRLPWWQPLVWRWLVLSGWLR